MIGAAVADNLSRSGVSVTLATRRPGSGNPGRLFLDLGSNPGEWPELPPVEAALISAAVTSIEDCEQSPEQTSKVNVAAVATLSEKLTRQGSYVLFLSTNRVFDGVQACVDETEPQSPVTEYGRQKAEAEARLLAMASSCGILRLSRVLGPSPGLFTGWKEALANGKPVEAFDDMVLAPVTLKSVVKVISELLLKKAEGIFQMSGDKDISYTKVAKMLADDIGADPNLVQRVSAHQRGLGYAAPANTTLSTKRLEDVLNIKVPGSLEAIRQTISQL